MQLQVVEEFEMDWKEFVSEHKNQRVQDGSNKNLALIRSLVVSRNAD
jgi:hypothetical protein